MEGEQQQRVTRKVTSEKVSKRKRKWQGTEQPVRTNVEKTTVIGNRLINVRKTASTNKLNLTRLE